MEVINVRTWERRLRFVALAAALGLGLALVAGCDGDGTPDPTATAPIASPPTDTPSGDLATATTTPGRDGPADGTPQITSPVEGATVVKETQVEITAPADFGDSVLHVLVRPIPDDPNQDYFVQAVPTSLGGGLWLSRPVFFGLDTDPPGTPFRVCAVLAELPLNRGDRLPALAGGPSHCVNVTRQ